MSFNPEYFYPTVIVNIPSLNGGIFGTVKSTDIYPAVDVTDQTQSPSGTTKPYQIVQLLNYVLNSLGLFTYFPVLAAATSNLNATYNNGASGVGATLTNAGTQVAFTLDGQTGVLNGRYLIQMQSSAFQNGIYTLTTIGSASTNWILTRSSDFNSANSSSSPPPNGIINDGIVYVFYGTSYSNTFWQDSFTAPLIIGTTSINYTEYTSAPLQVIPNNYILANISGGLAAAIGNPLTSVIDSAIGSTQGAILYRNATQWVILSPGANGQFLQTQGSSANVQWANPLGTTWVDQTTSPITMTTNTGYTSDAGASLITFTLPTTSSIGDFIEINGKGSGGWTIAQASGQQIHVSNSSTTSGASGSLSSSHQYDCVRLRCITANTIWDVVSQQSTGLTIV